MRLVRISLTIGLLLFAAGPCGEYYSSRLLRQVVDKKNTIYFHEGQSMRVDNQVFVFKLDWTMVVCLASAIVTKY